VPPDEHSRQKPTGEVYFEFHSVGNAVKITAIDAETGIEVAVQAPASLPQADMQRLALRKLQRRLQSET
jgi:hypothetical protein